MNFSVCLIAKNESKTLPRLVKSLGEFQKRGGEILFLDTGSIDDTAEIARGLGCQVFEVGDMFRQKIGKVASQINKRFGDNSEEPIVAKEDELFNYSAARNFIAEKALNDMICMPDCDEVYTKFNLDAVCKLIEEGAQQLEYSFVYNHDEYGKPLIQFTHCKFYNRKKLQWTGIIHEILKGEAKRVFTDEIVLEHYQESKDRSGYLKGLALDCFLHPDNDRNSHYFGRELLWTGRPKSAIRELERHIAMNKWPAERSQSLIFLGEAYEAIGQNEKAIECWHKAYDVEPSRREPLIKLAEYYWKRQDAQRTAVYAAAAMEIAQNGFYANNTANYTWFPHEMMIWAKVVLKDHYNAKYHFDKALAYKPDDYKYLADRRFFYPAPDPYPFVSIIVPTLGRTVKLERLLRAIKENANYQKYEVIVIHDGEQEADIDYCGARVYRNDERLGVPKTVKRAVELAKGELVMYLGNDCIPEADFLLNAVHAMYGEWGQNMDGLIGINDGYWHGEFATHWLASKKLLPHLGGEFFHTGYNHTGCDNELTEMCRKVGKYFWAENAKVYHDHPIQNGFKEGVDEVYQIAYNSERMKHDRELLKERSELLGFPLKENFIKPVNV